MLPVRPSAVGSPAPARSRSLGSRANTDGGEPRGAGGSPADRPTSPWAMAKRGRLSIISTTSSPRARDHSAIRGAGGERAESARGGGQVAVARRPPQRVRRDAFDAYVLQVEQAFERRPAVEGAAQAVEHAAEQGRTDPHGQRLARGPHLGARPH